MRLWLSDGMGDFNLDAHGFLAPARLVPGAVAALGPERTTRPTLCRRV